MSEKPKTMTKILTFSLVFFELTMFSQDIKTMLQSGSWYAMENGKTGEAIFTRKSSCKDQTTYKFKEDGRIIHCGLTTESALDANGKKITSSGFRCDSVWTYEVKNGMLKMQLLKQKPDYYKIAFGNTSFLLNPIKEEEFNR